MWKSPPQFYKRVTRAHLEHFAHASGTAASSLLLTLDSNSRTKNLLVVQHNSTATIVRKDTLRRGNSMMNGKSDLAYKKLALQIVGPEKSNPHLLRQTDGDHIFVFFRRVKFLRENAFDQDEFVGQEPKVLKSWTSDVIIYPHM